MKKYRTIYTDPPWPESGAGSKFKHGADAHYKLLPVEKIINLYILIRKIAMKNSHLYLWVTNNYLDAGLRVLHAWGFRYVTTITWAKDKAGLGYYYFGQTEHCLFGVKGRFVPRFRVSEKDSARPDFIRGAAGLKKQKGFITPTTLIAEKKTVHSRKPDIMRELIKTVSYPPMIELFARVKTKGFDVWGDEIDSDIDFQIM